MRLVTRVSWLEIMYVKSGGVGGRLTASFATDVAQGRIVTPLVTTDEIAGRAAGDECTARLEGITTLAFGEVRESKLRLQSCLYQRRGSRKERSNDRRGTHFERFKTRNLTTRGLEKVQSERLEMTVFAERL